MEHLDQLKMKIRKYPADYIFEFDTLDELREFDESYICNTRSEILKYISTALNCEEKDIRKITAFKTGDNAAAGIQFSVGSKRYEFEYQTSKLRGM